jgi:hypothetical protein
MVLVLFSLVISLIALSVNVGGLIRRPRITADWGVIQEGNEYSSPQEGLWIIVTDLRRPIQVSEVGILVLPKKTWRRQLGQWQLRDGNHSRHPLGAIKSVTLSDGQTVEVGIELDQAIGELGQQAGAGRDYCYVMASGKVYFVRANSKLRHWLAGEG